MAFYSDANFVPERAIGYLVRVCHQLGSANMDRLFAEQGLSHVQWSALLTIHYREGLTCAALARELAHDKGAMTRMIDALEAKGWVVRTRDEADRRLNNLALTDDGVSIVYRCRDKLIDCWNQWLGDWSEDEIASFIGQLQKLRRTLEESDTCVA